MTLCILMQIVQINVKLTISIRLLLERHPIESHSKSSSSSSIKLRKLGALKTNARTCSVASSQLSALEMNQEQQDL